MKISASILDPMQWGKQFLRLLKRRFTVKETVVISVIYFILVTSVFSLMLFVPYQKQLNQLGHKHQKLNSKHRQMEQTLESLSKRQSQQQLSSDKAVVPQQPTQYLVPLKNHYLTSLLAMFQQHHLALVKSQIPQPEQTNGPFNKSRVVLELEGHYSDLGNFLFTLKEFPMLTSYHSFSMEPLPDSYLNRMEVVLDVYLFQQDEVKL